MQRGALSLAETPLDLQATIESGQSYLWTREDGRMYRNAAADGWYVTVVRPDGWVNGEHTPAIDDPQVVRVRQRDGHLEWEASFDATAMLRHRLRLDDDLATIRSAARDDPIVAAAYDRYWGLRLVRDPPFETVISFICSAQMRVERIHEMQVALARSYGERVTFDGHRYDAFPTPDALAAATEAELRELGLGYRAPYVRRSAEMIAADEVDPTVAREMAYEEARKYLQQFVGVGQKVADCICLFSLGFLEAVPLDTWIRRTIAEYFPGCDRDTYAETSRAIRERLGGQYAGYAQTYLFHHLRTDDVE